MVSGPPTAGWPSSPEALRVGRWVALGGGGYEVGQVVPRAWTHLLAEVTGAQVNGATPDPWRQEVWDRVGGPVPEGLSDLRGAATLPIAEPWTGSTGTPLDESILATRKAVFPLLGLEF